MTQTSFAELVRRWSVLVSIPVPAVSVGGCPKHALADHYCRDQIFATTEESLRHEFWHYVFDLIRRGILDNGDEEDVIELLMSDRTGVVVPKEEWR